MKYKVGDIVRYKPEAGASPPSAYTSVTVFRIQCVHPGQRNKYHILPRPQYNCGDTCPVGAWQAGDYELDLAKETKLTNKIMKITEKFTLALTPEPQRSFRKAGITNGDNILTDEGAKIFLTWLLKENEDAFKKEVVDGLLEEEK